MPKTLLLADDSVTIQKVVGISFASEDIALVAVDNGTAAVAKAKEVRPDIVLADVVMPGLSGYDVCRAIKSDPTLRHIPVLLLTGTFEAFDEVKAREVGADGHITKPFEAQLLVDTVNQRLAAAAAAARAASAPASAAPVAKPAAPAPKGSLFKDDEPFDFLQEETTEPSGLSGKPKSDLFPPSAERADEDAFSFADTADDLGVESGETLEAEPLEMDEALTQVDSALSSAAPLEPSDEDASAETLPPGAALLMDDGESPAATQVLFPESAAAHEDAQDTRVLFSSAETTGAGTVSARDVGVSDPLADLIGGDRLTSDSERYDVSATDLGDPFADVPAAPAARGSATTVVMETSQRGEWADEEPMPAPPAVAAAPQPAAGTSGAPALGRDEMRAMLEKIAWEALGDVTERIVRESVQRIEQIAWEVIPRMAETLIQEEIRKLKGEDD